VVADIIAALHHPAFPAAETMLLCFQKAVKSIKDSGVRQVAIQLLSLPAQHLFALAKSEEGKAKADDDDTGIATLHLHIPQNLLAQQSGWMLHGFGTPPMLTSWLERGDTHPRSTHSSCISKKYSRENYGWS